MPNDEYLTRQEAADMLGVTIRTIINYENSGKLTRHTRLSRIYYEKSQVRNLNRITAQSS